MEICLVSFLKVRVQLACLASRWRLAKDGEFVDAASHWLRTQRSNNSCCYCPIHLHKTLDSRFPMREHVRSAHRRDRLAAGRRLSAGSERSFRSFRSPDHATSAGQRRK